MNHGSIGFKTGSIELILRGTNLYVSNGDLLESTISGAVVLDVAIFYASTLQLFLS